MSSDIADIFVIGGGINGCGIARDAAGRGYSVVLAEMNDLASATSSGSTKLVHGGLRYLEHYEFRLVREALIERERLWAMAPHIIWPLRFVLPHHKGLRPRWFLRLGLFLYDHIGGRKRLPAARALDLTKDPAGGPLKDNYRLGFEYSDCWVDDARLTVLNARDAADRGAEILTRSKVIAAVAKDGIWHLTIQMNDSTVERQARVLVNAAGPWVEDVLGRIEGAGGRDRVRLVQGSHIVVPRLFDGERPFIFQNADGRVVFAIPYEDDFTLIGTTDHEYQGDPSDAALTDGETDYLLASAGDYFNQPISRDDIVWHYAAVRPLYDDGASKAQEATRDYVLKSGREAGAGLVSIFGGKITTYRRLAEEVLERIDGLQARRTSPWTAGAPLPGGDFPVDGFDTLLSNLAGRYPFMDQTRLRRLGRLYGTEAVAILGDAVSTEDLGAEFGAGLTEAEVRYLIDKEWARTTDDILWRRTKLGLRMTPKEVGRLQEWFAQSDPRAEASP